MIIDLPANKSGGSIFYVEKLSKNFCGRINESRVSGKMVTGIVYLLVLFELTI